MSRGLGDVYKRQQTYLQDNLQCAEPLVQQIGCVIGTHAGPGAFGLAFFDQGLEL